MAAFWKQEANIIRGRFLERNNAALLEKMKLAGPAMEYSNATAAVG